jgi:glucosylceramidase
MTTVQHLFPAQNQYTTEASGGTWIADEVKTDFETITETMRNWSRSYVKWALALDPNRGPHVGGCGDCTGLITVNEIGGAVSYNIDYYTLGHFSKFVLPGATRIWSSNIQGIITAAFLNPDGSRVLVAYNDSAESLTFPVVWGARSITVTLPSLAGATLTWSGSPGKVCRDQEPARAVTDRRMSGACWQYTLPATDEIRASSYNDVVGLETEITSDLDGGYDLGYAANGYWASYSNVDFGSGVSTVDARVASDGSGGTLEFRLDSITGPLIAQATIPSTGGWQTWTNVTAPVSGAKGVHDLYLVYSYTGTNQSGIGNLNWFQFQ